MTRECQVQICEKLGVQFPGSTRPGRLRPSPARFARDEWELPIREWVGDRIEVTVAEMLKGALEQSVTHSGEIRAAKILKRRLGFRQCRPREGNRRYVCYRREPSLAEATNDPEPEVTNRRPQNPIISNGIGSYEISN
jgi:hypothetical protein